MSNQAPYIITSSTQDELILHAPIKFTTNGINCFLKHTYNHPKYSAEILPHNTGHLIQMLQHGQSTGQDHEYMIAVLRLFRQKISSCTYISAAELERITALFPPIFYDYLKPKPNSKSKTHKLKNLAVRLIENCLGKTLWDSSDPSRMLKELITIGNQLENMYKSTLIDDPDDLNDLLHMLIDRFIYVIDLIGADLPSTFYKDLKQQLELAPWMQIAEIEDLVHTKKDKIHQALLRGQIKGHLSEKSVF